MYVPYLRLEIILGHYQNYQAEASLQLATFITYYIYIYKEKRKKNNGGINCLEVMYAKLCNKDGTISQSKGYKANESLQLDYNSKLLLRLFRG